MWGRPPNGLKRAAVLPECDELREKMWKSKRDTDISVLLGVPWLAKIAAQLLIETGEFVQFSHVRQVSPEDHVSDSHVSIGEQRRKTFRIRQHKPS